jgi:hypothetical protein
VIFGLFGYQHDLHLQSMTQEYHCLMVLVHLEGSFVYQDKMISSQPLEICSRLPLENNISLIVFKISCGFSDIIRT